MNADTRHQFYNFVYTHNKFGPKSLEQLTPLLKDLLEIRLSDVTFTEPSLINKLSKEMFARDRTQHLMKLALTGINLGNDNTVKDLCDLL